jgi:hypothetical protein
MNDTPTPMTNALLKGDLSAYNVDVAKLLDLSRQLERERNAAFWCHEKCFEDRKRIIKKLNTLQEQVKLTIMENLHLADGDNCTLKRLKDAIGFSLDSPENA